MGYKEYDVNVKRESSGSYRVSISESPTFIATIGGFFAVAAVVFGFMLLKEFVVYVAPGSMVYYYISQTFYPGAAVAIIVLLVTIIKGGSLIPGLIAAAATGGLVYAAYNIAFVRADQWDDGTILTGILLMIGLVCFVPVLMAIVFRLCSFGNFNLLEGYASLHRFITFLYEFVLIFYLIIGGIKDIWSIDGFNLALHIIGFGFALFFICIIPGIICGILCGKLLPD